MRIILFLSLFALMFSCRDNGSDTKMPQVKHEPEAISLLGKELYPRILPENTEAEYKKKLEDTRLMYKANSKEETNIIWYGRRLAYMDRFREAIDVFSKGLEIHPDSWRILRHRGHRYISIREFDRAIADLSRAVALIPGTKPEIEPDGIPNRINKPLSTVQWNIYYHLGLAYYLKGDFENARRAYEACHVMSDNPDLLVAVTDWLYMTYRRLGNVSAADSLLVPITSDMEIIENDPYYNRILMYKGVVSPEELLTIDETREDASLVYATRGYGLGNWYLYNGDTARATEIFKKVVDSDYWPAFGYIAAEAELARLE